MAPRGPAKTRDYDYSNVGKAGRRTGITLKEGKRDEHGMEDIEGMWSSPENSPLRDNGADERNDASIGSDGMSMDEENAPDPADFLTSVKSARGPYHLPPVARSPIKSGLTGSPRRTPGLRSSPSPQHDILSSSPSDGKGLGSAAGEPRQDVSPLTNRSVNTPSFHHAASMRNKANKASEPALAAAFSDSDANSQFNGDENADVFEQIQNDFADGFETSDNLLGDQREDVRQDALDLDPQSATPEPHPQRQTKTSIRNRRTGRNEEIRAEGIAQPNSAENQDFSKKRKRPGRPPKSQAQPNPKDGSEEERPSKKTKAPKNTADEPKPSGHPQLDKVVENYVNRTGPLKGRSLYILKREAPTDNSTTHTRSGRVSVRPLAYWRNERCVYGDGEAAEGQRYPLSTIKEVIRTEEPALEKRKANNRRPSGKSKSKKKNHEEESDSEEYVDTWEKNEGVLHGYVRKWDPEVQTGTEDEEVVDIAYAPSGIETRDVKGSKFRFAKLLSSPFLGSGIVELPPGGVKKPKNSKKMHMVFYVCNGRVQIDISGVQFSAGKGCVFQVPRGNYYSFANTHGKDARLFFTQGCVPMDKDDSAPESASKLETMEGDAATPITRPSGPGKGRPKGKQKGKK
ncbi:mitotic fidelity of chromosome transmission- protein [Aspergillus melleus]|uniref:Mitotic fidelity of chromosome transmission-protein n=1 Tax=Aspergillus melleus TaxID=138277 RepID=A0ACC3B112_9EURO|nr:mitotic fidelity of chromosome transmission- protein [Aspergillus melleus]